MIILTDINDKHNVLRKINDCFFYYFIFNNFKLFFKFIYLFYNQKIKIDSNN